MSYNMKNNDGPIANQLTITIDLNSSKPINPETRNTNALRAKPLEELKLRYLKSEQTNPNLSQRTNSQLVTRDESHIAEFTAGRMLSELRARNQYRKVYDRRKPASHEGTQ